tara:strand:+ start:437 stop:1333 length:897 start_codon:yes stop_codon:yes gene_type:complete
MINRRSFIEKTAIITAAAHLSCTNKKPMITHKFKMGYQLYSIRDEMAKDPIPTLKSLKSMGYEDFEVYGYDEKEGTIYGHSPSDFLQILDDLGISVTSGHYGFSPFLHESDDKLRWFVDECIKAARAMNSNFITWPWLDPKYRNIENFKVMTEKLNLIGEQVSKSGLGFAYHNHGFEFEDHDGENGFDIIIAGTDPELVKLQMDMYWVMHSSDTTPKELISKQPGRYVMWHIKDMDKVSRDYTELGNGSIDYLDILPDPQESGLEFYYIEQGGNYAHNSTRSAADSAEYLKKHLQKFL